MLQQPNLRRKKLSFLETFFRALGVKIKDIPESLVRPSALSYARQADDISLKVLRRIMDYFGFRLHVRLVPRKPKFRPNNHYTNYNPRKNMAFLREYISKLGMTHSQFAKSIGLTRESVTYWLKTDNIRISRLYYIAFCTGARLDIHISPIVEQEKKENYPCVRTTLSFLNEFPIKPEILVSEIGGEEDI